MQLEGEGSYECSVTGLAFEASESVLVRYSVLSWSKFGSFLSNSWKFAGPIFDIDTVNKEASVLTSIHLPHSVCLAQSPDNAVPFKILCVVDEVFREAFIEPPSGYSGSHVKWRVKSLSPVCPIIPADEQAEYHGIVLIYKQINTNNNIFHVYLVLNNISAIKDIRDQVQSYPNKYVRVTKSSFCRLVEGIFRFSSEPEGVVRPQELEFTLAVIALKGFFEVFYDKQPPFEWSVRKKSTDEVVWSAVIRADDCQAAFKENPRKRAKYDDDLRAKIHRGQDLSEKQLMKVAKNFGSEWKEAAIYLDLLTKDLDEILETEQDVTMQKHRMLVRWKNSRKPGEATAAALLESLEDMDKLSTYVRGILHDLMKADDERMDN
ncbi:NACHT, LRR and PYD domains-containing protein 1b allele 3-like [Gambusia affinis]|uniref:NACHT, LRR and PYD domains-containing protein 1b allele 3-like n=1 Tax=Gambusia affinis TaxID=33528 RepID=UPI001CDB6829|nr:NACHT, LRR and PYD domains-containing protein 1b allele 3-like [Gambusia affinis]